MQGSLLWIKFTSEAAKINMITGMNHITLAVKDINKSFEFYSKVIGLKPLIKWDKGAYFLVGDFWFCLNMDDMRQATACYTHYAFSMSKEIFEIMSQKIITSSAKILKENTSPGESLYFLDPDDYKLEIHVGNWSNRLKAKKEKSGNCKNVVWFV